MLPENTNQKTTLNYLITHVERKQYQSIKTASEYVLKKIGISNNGLVSIEVTEDDFNTEKLNIVVYTKDESIGVNAFVELVNRCANMFQLTKGDTIKPFPTNITTVDELKSCPQYNHYIFISWSVDLLNGYE